MQKRSREARCLDEEILFPQAASPYDNFLLAFFLASSIGEMEGHMKSVAGADFNHVFAASSYSLRVACFLENMTHNPTHQGLESTDGQDDVLRFSLG